MVMLGAILLAVGLLEAVWGAYWLLTSDDVGQLSKRLAVDTLLKVGFVVSTAHCLSHGGSR